MTVEERVSRNEARLDNIEARFVEMREDVREIRDLLSKQRGFLAGASLMASVLGSALVALVVYVWNHVRA